MAESFEQRTIGESLLGMVAFHLGKGGINCGVTHQVGCELVASLAAYREEEHRLYPQVYLLGPTDQDLLRALAPGAAALMLGKVSDTAGTHQAASAALKNCASLAIEGWCVYLKRLAKEFEFGLFLATAEPNSSGVDETLIVSGLPAVLLRHCAENTVELINGNQCRLEISLTTATPSKRSMSAQIVDFARVVCSDVEQDNRGLATQYIVRLLTDSLRGSHGALLAAVPYRKRLDRKKLSDGVILDVPIPLVQTKLRAIREQSVSVESILRSQESLLRGMITSDGVTVLGTDGSIRAFRIFVQQGTRKSSSPTPTTSGGARSRAFALLRTYLGTALSAVLFRSQDGRMEVAVTT